MLLLIKLKNIHYDTSCLNIMICLTLFILLVASLQGSPFCCDSLPILPPYFPLPFSFAFIYFLFCFFYPFPLYLCQQRDIFLSIQYQPSTVDIVYVTIVESTISMTPNIPPIHFISCPFNIALANSNYM